MRRIAPALLVGTAAVLVVGAADPGLATLLTGDDNKTNTSEKTTGSTTAESGSTAQSGTVDSGRTADEAETDDDEAVTDDGSDTAGTTTGTTGTAATGSGACTAAEVTGPIVQTEWGLVQVAAQVTNGRVCAIRTIMTPDGDRKSVSINARAVPELEAAVLAAGDASFDNISGATVTSDGYRESLQSIIDQQ